jgi:hypothetical protein
MHKEVTVAEPMIAKPTCGKRKEKWEMETSCLGASFCRMKKSLLAVSSETAGHSAGRGVTKHQRRLLGPRLEILTSGLRSTKLGKLTSPVTPLGE